MRRVVLMLTNDEANSLRFAADTYAAGNSGHQPSEPEAARWRTIAETLYPRCAEPLDQPFRICLRPTGHDGDHGTDPDA